MKGKLYRVTENAITVEDKVINLVDLSDEVRSRFDPRKNEYMRDRYKETHIHLLNRIKIEKLNDYYEKLKGEIFSRNETAGYIYDAQTDHWATAQEIAKNYIDRLVREGVAFTRAYTQSPICTPSRSCFLTGRYPRTTKAIFNGNDTYSKDEKLITRLLADEGYTCGLAGKLHLTSAEGKVERRTDDGYTFFEYSQHPHNDWPDGGNRYQVWLNEKGVKWEEIYGGKFMTMATSSSVSG